MNLKNAIKTSTRAIRAQKSRSALTILGIVIGIASIIVLSSLGNGAENLILKQIQSMGSKTVIVLPGRQAKGPSDFAQTLSDSLKKSDYEALLKKENMPTLKKMMPLVFGASNGSYLNETYRLTIMGGTPAGSEIFDLIPEEGDFFSNEDLISASDVAVIGASVKKELFGDSDALGKKIKIKGRNFKIVGILPKKGQVSFFNFDDVVLIPYTTAQNYIFGIKYFHRFLIEAESEKDIDQTVRDAETTLREMHNITDPEKDDFNIETQADMAERIGVIGNILTLFLVAVAAVSLIVGGIGIMNIMLVSVTERTKEIGLRKAIGATNKNILTQFLIESVILTFVGGIIGTTIGTLVSFIASFILSNVVKLPWEFTFPISSAAIGIFVSGAIGVVFGLYPARKASLKSPIEALRYE